HHLTTFTLFPYTTLFRSQNVAYSNDKGRTWAKYSGNPVLDLKMKDFRDPKVFWHEASHKWVMVAALPRQHKIRFFASADLKHWRSEEHTSELQSRGHLVC